MVQKLDLTVTVFGGSGFIGRYAAQSLYRAGARVRIAEREPKDAYFLRTQGGVGQTQLVAADIRDRRAVRAAVSGSAAVVNLVGTLRGDFDSIHIEGARNVAEAAAEAGVAALVHVSAINAAADSPSRYGRTKGLGERAVREAFPAATVLRPSIVFGREDQFVNRFAQTARLLPAVPVVRSGVKLQPVWAADVGHAIARAALEPRRFGGRTYELGGPQVMTMRELIETVLVETGRERAIVELPDALASLMARAGSFVPGAPITRDEWLMLQRDNVVWHGADGFEAFDLAPTPLAAVAQTWLTAYRRNGRFSVTASPY